MNTFLQTRKAKGKWRKPTTTPSSPLLPFDCAQGLRPSSRRRAGFSLIELLMAITVLIIIVMIIALVFQQAHTAWGSGTRKAGAETTLRGIMGIMERDLAQAVDDTAFGGSINQFPPAGSYPPSTTPQEIKFITLDGTSRLPQLVDYRFDGANLIRNTYQVSAVSASSWTFSTTADAPSPGVILNGTQTISRLAFFVPSGSPAIGLPLRLEIEAHVIKQGAFAVVSGYSLGRGRSPSDKIVASP